MRLIQLVAWTAGIGLAVAGLAAVLDGPGHWLPSVAACLLCLVPALGTTAAVIRTERRGPVAALGAVLLAPVVRLVIVTGVGLVCGRLVPDFRDAPIRWWGWVFGMYLVTLVVETGVLLGRADRARDSAPPAGQPNGSP